VRFVLTAKLFAPLSRALNDGGVFLSKDPSAADNPSVSVSRWGWWSEDEVIFLLSTADLRHPQRRIYLGATTNECCRGFQNHPVQFFSFFVFVVIIFFSVRYLFCVKELFIKNKNNKNKKKSIFEN